MKPFLGLVCTSTTLSARGWIVFSRVENVDFVFFYSEIGNRL